MKRRRFVQSTVAAGLIASPIAQALADGQKLDKTPADFEGPFYPEGSRNKSNDFILGAPRSKVLHFRGQVVDVHGHAKLGALVDIWHTDPLGRYKHTKDDSPGDRWDDFQYWGEAIADHGGGFEFRTYVPGAYNPRPAHIHFKIWDNRRLLLTSQAYFTELGGTRGKSKSPRFSDLQTVSLKDAGNDELKTWLKVVV